MAQQSFYQSPGVLQGQDLEREERELRAELLALRGRQGTSRPIDTGRFLTLNMDPVADAVRESRLRQALATVSQKKADFQGKYLEAVAQRLRQFRQAEEGTPGEAPIIPNDDEGNPMPAIGGTKPNQRAFKDYLADPLPEVRGLAAEREKRYYERLKEAMNRASLPSIQAAGDDISQLREKPDWKEAQGAWWNTAGENGPVMAGPGVTQVPSPNDPSKVVNKYPSGKLGELGGGNTTVTVGGEKVGREVLLKGLDKDKEKATIAAEQLQAAQQGLQALSEGAKTGLGADTLEKAKSMVSYFTGIKFDSASNYGALAASLAANTIKELGGLGAQVSNTDRDFMAAATGGTMNTPEALERLLAIRAGHTYRYLTKAYPNLVEAGVAGSDAPEVRDALRTKYKMEVPALGSKFRTAEAEASFLAALQNTTYEQALEKVRKMRGEDGQTKKGRQTELDRIMQKKW